MVKTDERHDRKVNFISVTERQSQRRKKKEKKNVNNKKLERDQGTRYVVSSEG